MGSPSSIVIRAAVEEVRPYSFKLWIGKVFPTDRVESSEDTSPWRVLLEGSKAVQIVLLLSFVISDFTFS
jgi:hypothetical protein